MSPGEQDPDEWIDTLVVVPSWSRSLSDPLGAMSAAGLGAVDVEKGESSASKPPSTDDTNADDNGPGSEPTTKKLRPMVWSKEVSVSPDVPSISGVFDRKYSLVHKLAAEFVGDTIFVFIGALSALKSMDENNVTHAAFAHGLTIFVLVASLGHISGGHFNPAVTLSATLAGKFRPLYMVPYWIAQLAGGFTGALLVRAVTGKIQYERLQGGATLLSPGEEWYQGLIVETILTMILTQTILMTAVDTEDNILAPLAIGLTLTLDIFGAGSITGASMNPARSFGPSLAATIFSDAKDMWTYHYIYWAGPFLGASISALLYRTLFARQEFH